MPPSPEGRRADLARVAELKAISPTRWRELYWSAAGGSPSVHALAVRFGVADRTVKRLLVAAGLRVRTYAEQQTLERRRGRWKEPATRPGNPRLGIWWEETPKHDPRRKRALANLKRGRRPGKNRRRETKPCGWCGAPVTRIPSQFTIAGAFCDRSCAAFLTAHMRYNPDRPRPLIIEALRTALGTRPPTWEHLEPLIERFGATEEEALLLADTLKP